MTVQADRLRIFGEILEYALGCPVPARFAASVLERQAAWDAEFSRMIHSTAYEFRSELCVWELQVDASGKLHERRVSLAELLGNA